MNKLIILLTGVAVLSGCVNNYSKFYSGTPDARLNKRYIPSTEPIKIIHTNDFNTDERELIKKSFIPIGISSFNANTNSVSESQVKKQAEAIGAQIVLVNSAYTGSVTGIAPITTPTSSISYTNASANAYGSGGYATVNGNSTTTTYGSQTNYVPYSISKSDFAAKYFAKMKAKVGIIPKDLTDNERNEIGQNAGIKVNIIIDNTPAFFANIFTDDIIKSINGKLVGNKESYDEIIKSLPNGIVKVEIFRHGKIIFKEMNIDFQD